MLTQKILIIDDDHWLRKMFCIRLRSEGYEVEDASSGRLGFEKAKKFGPDLILSDLEMEGDDGIETLKRLKRNSTTSAIPVLMISANTTMETRDEALTYGAVDYIFKPILPQFLISRIKYYLNSRRN